MYGVIFIVLGSGPTGILRLFDRHDLISVQTVVEPIIRFVGAVILFYLSAPLAAFLAVWFAAMVCSRITMIAFAWRHLAALEKTKGMLRSFKRTASLSFLKDNTDLCRFVIGTHFTSTLNLNSLQLGTILSGWILGPAGAGLFRVAQQFADILVKPAQKLLIPAIYTDMAEYTAKGDHHTRRKMIIHTAMIATVISACVLGLFVVFGDTMLTLFAGEDYAEAHHLMLYLSLAGVLLIVTFPIEPFLMQVPNHQ
jgi:O-antigen/teichoic acid export membrane protein